MNGAQSLIRTLIASEVDVCFMNPGTSEMHFVAALDDVPEMRPVLALYEGVVTGAADGYARMVDRPAATLLHLGPGLTNGLSNIHNARRALTPMVNIVGDHATYHKVHDAPLNSDIEGLASPLSDWVHVSRRAENVAADAALAVHVARRPPGQIATLILPADASWGEARGPASPLLALPRAVPVSSHIDMIAQVLRSRQGCALLLGTPALREAGLRAASRIGKHTNAKLLCDTFVGRLQRGAGRPAVPRLNYFAEMAVADLENVKHLVLVGTKSPAAFFAYPGKPSSLVRDDTTVHVLAATSDDVIAALEQLADAVGAPATAYDEVALERPAAPSGALSSVAIGAAIGAHLPEHAIVVDEGNTEGIYTFFHTQGAPPHDWLFNTGGSIGLGLPCAVGAAVGCPDRKVVCLEGDGSAMYTIQALWTMARENLDVTTVVFSNRSYRILNIELTRVGATGAGERAKSMLDLTKPDLDFVAMARGMGVDAVRPDSAEAFTREFERAMRERGPRLIECVI
ncbi:MAG TPA: acetolactate synthase large subunit [Polyangiales bacterium]|nr:acetolactate synthase large subunit [Polyangiales bacterium]